jgi:2-succinyl-6-hydroxy-2,4-cyclohexadiene-1-carboxylate synthase
MPRLCVNGVGLNVEVRGEGPPLLLLHGFTGSARAWDPHVQVFSRQYMTIVPDLLGHGRSDAPADPARYGMERAVEDLADVLDALGRRQVAALGYSLGGRVALHLAHRQPDRVTCLLLEGASPGIADPVERAERRRADEELAELIEREGTPAFVERWESHPLWESQRTLPLDTRAELRRLRLRNSPTGLANSLRGLGVGAQPPLWTELPQLEAPALLVAGQLDVKFARIAAEMAALMPRARRALVAGAGHAAHLERPDDFNGVGLDFLASALQRSPASSSARAAGLAT